MVCFGHHADALGAYRADIRDKIRRLRLGKAPVNARRLLAVVGSEEMRRQHSMQIRLTCDIYIGATRFPANFLHA